MISIGICDDEEESREKLRRFCREFFGPDSELREYASGEEFLKTLENQALTGASGESSATGSFVYTITRIEGTHFFACNGARHTIYSIQ